MDATSGVLAEFEGCLERLRMDHVDLLLLHWPGPPPGGRPNRPNNLTPAQHVAKRLAMWRALEQIYAAGKAKAIGVSNYTIAHLEALLPHCTVRPMVNQIECHLRSAQRPLVEFCQKNAIAVTAYSPLKGADLDDPVLGAIAASHRVSPATIALQWLLQRNIAVIPRSSKHDRVRSNFRDCPYSAQ